MTKAPAKDTSHALAIRLRTEWFRAAVLHFLPSLASTAAILALLDNRPARTTVIHWKNGDHSPPDWALDLLAGKIAARVEVGGRLYAARATLPPAPDQSEIGRWLHRRYGRPVRKARECGRGDSLPGARDI